MKHPKPGDTIRLTTDNPYLDGAEGSVVRVEEWGAYIVTAAAATGAYRAAWSEMILIDSYNGHSENSDSSREMGYSGDICQKCGGSRLRRAGACFTCEDCGDSSSCS